MPRAVAGTALMEAAGVGAVGSVRVLLAAGALINAADTDGATALLDAAQGGYELATRCLLDAGADITATGPEGWFFAGMLEESVKGCTALILAARGDHLGVVRLLVERGARVNAMDAGGDTALQRAVDRHAFFVAQYLLAHGADSSLYRPDSRKANAGGATRLRAVLDRVQLEYNERLVDEARQHERELLALLAEEDQNMAQEKRKGSAKRKGQMQIRVGGSGAGAGSSQKSASIVTVPRDQVGRRVAAAMASPVASVLAKEAVATPRSVFMFKDDLHCDRVQAAGEIEDASNLFNAISAPRPSLRTDSLAQQTVGVDCLSILPQGSASVGKTPVVLCSGPGCSHIGRRGMMKCSRCMMVWYCGVPCQALHWPVYRQLCHGSAVDEDEAWNYMFAD